MFFKVGIEKLDWNDITRLIDEPYHEDIHLDFKEKTPEKSDKQGWERVYATICAFANTEGGLLLFGIKEEGGAAKEIIPFQLDDFEGIRLQFVEKIRLYIEPVPLVKFYPIRKNEGTGCLFLKVAKTFNGPHMIVNHTNISPNRQGKFYKRVESQVVQ